MFPSVVINLYLLKAYYVPSTILISTFHTFKTLIHKKDYIKHVQSLLCPFYRSRTEVLKGNNGKQNMDQGEGQIYVF